MDYSDIVQCRGCHAPATQLQTVLTLEPMPLAGMFCKTAEEAIAAPIFPLSWVHCSRCGLVQVCEDISDESLFSSYNYSSSSVPGLVRHFAGYAEFLAARYGAPDVRFLEIGCNDGVLLNQLPRQWRLMGCDPSDVAAKAARANTGYELLPLPFSVATAKSNSLENSIDVISGSNCLAHISDLRDVFQAAWLALRPGGHFWIEVHDLRALLSGGQWDTIYHEHKAEWSQESLTRCLELLGFTHKETIRTPMHGGALRSLFEKTGNSRTNSDSNVPLDKGLPELNEAYQRRYETDAARQLLAAQDRGERIAAYGAAGRANVYLNQMSKLRFDYIVDEAPLRVNKFIPRVATPILPPTALQEKPAKACLITAWNYRDDIIRKNQQHKGVWLTAFQED
jgi:SAM-dependent methyltransferase